MRKNYVLLSILALIIATSTNINKVSATPATFDPNTTVSVTESNSNEVDETAAEVEAFLKGDEPQEKEEEVKDDEKKDEEEVKDDEKKDEEEKEEEVKDDEKKDEEEEKEEAKTVSYTVVSGDYLIKIAQNQMGDGSRWREIVELNKDKYPSLETNPDLIYPGWTFELPTGSKPQDTSASSSGSSSSGSSTISAKVGEAIDSSGWNSVNPCEPMPSYISSEYGGRIHPITGEYKFHNGVDLPVPTGTRLNAMANGIVTDCGTEYGGGTYIRVKYDNGYETFYCHLQSYSAKIGDRVQCGQQIAVSDNTGAYTTGSHLHMEVKINGERVNPRDAVTSIKNL